jgi:hypothetical protein
LGAVQEASAHQLSNRAANDYAWSLAHTMANKTTGEEHYSAVRQGPVYRHSVRYALTITGKAYEPVNDTARREFSYRCSQQIIVKFRVNSNYLTYAYYRWNCNASASGRVCTDSYCEDWGLRDQSNLPGTWQWFYNYRWPSIFTSLA